MKLEQDITILYGLGRFFLVKSFFRVTRKTVRVRKGTPRPMPEPPTPTHLQRAFLSGSPVLTPSAATPTRWAPGSVVRVMPETSPGVRPELAESIPCAYVVSDDGDGTVLVRPAGTQRARRVSGAFVYPACIDGASSLSFRGEGGGSAGRAVSRARSAGAEATAEADRTVAAASVKVAGGRDSAGYGQEKGRSD